MKSIIKLLPEGCKLVPIEYNFQGFKHKRKGYDIINSQNRVLVQIEPRFNPDYKYFITDQRKDSYKSKHVNFKGLLDFIKGLNLKNSDTSHTILDPMK